MIDKSGFQQPFPRRPAQAYHLTFTQPRAMGRKTGDDWRVPLCIVHYRSLHATGGEQA